MRVFLAIDFPQEIKENLLKKINDFKKIVPDLRWIKKPALHLTIKFIGEIEESLVSEIRNRLADAFQNIDPFDLKTTYPGFFPNPHKARVFYLDIQPSDSLKRCFDIIETKLQPLGIEKEKRRFKPHITLARIKNLSLPNDKTNILLNPSFPEMTIKTKEIILMQSELLYNGARYTPVQRFSLRAT